MVIGIYLESSGTSNMFIIQDGNNFDTDTQLIPFSKLLGVEDFQKNNIIFPINELKEHIQTAIPSHIQVNWSNIAEPHLDILMINHIFFDSPNIKSLIQNNHINVLQIANNADKNGSIEDDILYLPLNHLHSLHQWLNERLAKNAAIEKVSPPQATNTTIHRKQIGEVLQEILNPKNGKIQLFDHNGLIAIADPRNEWVWQNPMLQTLHTDPSLNYTYATQNDQLWITETPQQDLKQWLWNLLWASKDFNELCPPLHQVSI